MSTIQLAGDATTPDLGAFKTPSLRGTKFVTPFMHNAWYTTLHEIVSHYNHPPAAPFGQTESSRCT